MREGSAGGRQRVRSRGAAPGPWGGREYAMVTSGAFVGPWNQIRLPPGIVLSIAFNGDSTLEVEDGDSFGAFTTQRVNIPVQPENDLTMYPYDRYQLHLQVNLKFINTSDGNSTSFVPFVAAMRVRSPAFSFEVPPGSTWTLLSSIGSSFGVTFVAERTGITKAFSMFVFVAMWTLSIFCVVQAADIVFWRRRPISLEVPAFSATLLFALPAVRQVQPGVPDVGAVIDVVGFFWNMVMQAIVCCVLLAAIYAQGKVEMKHSRAEQDHKSWRDNVLLREFRVRNGLTIGPEDVRAQRSITVTPVEGPVHSLVPCRTAVVRSPVSGGY
ncbi:hypothetical protein TSOC_013448 [Tetrabaena socialis]|uniref:Uncharacterized protein n=1 Tax=Tetrabaena socialis TaxID=47790 RepID=A0A2J7ZKB6_9CHLO|nr:hypothetical protein TSOC_013448 [Tetrabaena socialis]|eukprot:PNH00716.1 hypothetical protein TSOC_013448 [Tetrabaena socialis]